MKIFYCISCKILLLKQCAWQEDFLMVRFLFLFTKCSCGDKRK